MNFGLLSNKVLRIHIAYWIVFILFFTIVWGTYDHNYYRNFMVQLWSLPARLVLVYGTICFLLPKFFLKKRYIKFIVLFGLLLFLSAVLQRIVMLFIVEGRHLPYRSQHYFKVTEFMNTLLDVNLALILPLAYTLYKFWNNSQKKAQQLEEENQKLIKDSNEAFIYLKKGKALQKVFLKDVIFIESLKNYVRVKTVDKDITSYSSISAMEELLPEEKFLRVHRSFIVSIVHITSFSPTQINLESVVIPIGRKYKESVKIKLGYY
ncbi:LytTR family DNA-binding domain-containing protein [Winogradskyella sp.]|uniref:LytR/AlgR family response regulator transcription factor n=1 Tax=Winogradskyella sp. TaxID=1883156 RepID=UPI00260F0D73|nr:LytTR family DNA-binding domain-containing protein [Winogradskyella sp.]